MYNTREHDVARTNKKDTSSYVEINRDEPIALFIIFIYINMRGPPFFQKNSYYGLAIILVVIMLSSLFDSKEHFNLHTKHSSSSKHPNISRVKNRKILILYTGGTIGMKETSQGYAPKKGYLEKTTEKNIEYTRRLFKYYFPISSQRVSSLIGLFQYDTQRLE